MIIHAAYGSSKDISVYSALDLKPKQIFIIGKVGRKHHSMATVLSEGYAAHLSALQCHGGSRPAQGNARMLLTSRGRFGHNASMRRRRYVFIIFLIYIIMLITMLLTKTFIHISIEMV
jgi:hypothetical protein